VTARGEQPRRQSSGEVEGALEHEESRAKITGVLLTFSRFDWRLPNGGQATDERRRGGL
jgi:hypothetical protein